MKSEFQVEEYIRESLLKVKDAEERKHLEEVLKGVFLPLQDYVEQEYENLAVSVRNKAVQREDGFEIYTGMVPRKNFDIEVSNLYAMDENDRKERKIVAWELLRDLESEGHSYLYQIVITGEYSMVKEMAESSRKFAGTVRTKEDTYEAVFAVEPERRYMEKLKNLYHAFLDNGREWRTICAPYLFRIFRVFLLETECPKEEEIEEIRIDFQEYEPYVCYDMVPVWNVTSILEKTSIYPEPCIDQMHYQHVIFRHRLDEHAQYLPAAQGIQILDCIRKNGDLVITCEEEEPRLWELYVWKGRTRQPSEISLFGNGIRNPGIIKSSTGIRIRTKAELFHFVKMLGFEKYLELSEVRQVEGSIVTGVYSMDPFLEDEIRLVNNTHTLVLCFQPKDLGNAFNYDIMSYLVSRVQWYYPEYNCTGTFGMEIENGGKQQ